MHSIAALYHCALHYVLLILTIILSSLPKKGGSIQSISRHISDSVTTISDLPRTPLPPNFSTNAGVTVHISQKALTYFTGIAESAFPALVEHRKLPDQAGTGWSISKLRFHKVATPTMTTTLDPGRGFQLRGNVPEFNIFGHYQIGYGWFGTSGFLDAHLTNLTFASLVTITASPTGRASIIVDSCTAAVTNAKVTFHGAWSSGLVNTISGYVEKYLEEITDQLICAIARQAAASTQDSENSERPSTSTTASPPLTTPTRHHRHPGQRSQHRSAMLQHTCRLDTHQPPPSGSASSEEDPKDKPPTSSTPTFPIASTLFAMNMSMIQKPVFSESFVSLGLDGAVLYKNIPSPHSTRKPTIYPTIKNGNESKMLNMVIRDTIPNSFLDHIFDNNLASVDRNISFSSLPLEMQGIVGALCFYCKAHITGRLSHKPQIRISRTKGVELGLQGWIRSELVGMFTRLELFMVNAAVHAKVFPYVEDNKLVSNTLFDQLSLDSSGATGRISKVLGYLLEETVHSMSAGMAASIFSPDIQNELKLVYQGGVPLPKMMGLEFTESKLQYDDGALIIETDLQYDPTDFIARIKEGLTQEDAAVQSVDAATSKAVVELSAQETATLPPTKKKSFLIKPTATLSRMDNSNIQDSDYFIKDSPSLEDLDDDYSGNQLYSDEEKL